MAEGSEFAEGSYEEKYVAFLDLLGFKRKLKRRSTRRRRMRSCVPC